MAACFSSLLLRCYCFANESGLESFKTQGEADIVAKDKPQGSLGDLMVDDGIQVKHTDIKGVPVARQISILGLTVQ